MNPVELFDRTFAARANGVEIRQEKQSDGEFLIELFGACSPMCGIVPVELLNSQGHLQRDSFLRQFPNAMYRIGLLDKRPIGRFVVDWYGHDSHGVDLAVLPEARSSGLAMAWLRSWIDVADHVDRACTLMVRADNPARLLYLRLGFEPLPDALHTSPFVEMRRASRKWPIQHHNGWPPPSR